MIIKTNTLPNLLIINLFGFFLYVFLILLTFSMTVNYGGNLYSIHKGIKIDLLQVIQIKIFKP
jgi:hypothetical protein